MAAFWLLALLLAPGPVRADGVSDVVQPCEGHGREDYLHYCCKRSKRIRIAVIPDFESSGYIESFIEAADDILGPHNIHLAAQTLQVDGMRQITAASNMGELCRTALGQYLAHVGDGFRFRGVLPFIFVNYAPSAKQGPDSNGMHLADFRAECTEALEFEYRSKPEMLQAMMRDLPSLSVVIMNSHGLSERRCWETIAHELGHSVGRGHDSAPGNVMGACSPDVHRDKLSPAQVAAYCRADPNR